MVLALPIVINTTGMDISTYSNVGMLLITCISAFYAYRAYRHQKERSRKESACKLAKLYADEILNQNAFVSNVFRISKIDEYIKGEISIDKMRDFSHEEFAGILKERSVDFDEFMCKVRSVDPFVILNCKIACISSLAERDRVFSEFVSIDKDSGEMKIRNASFLIHDFFDDVMGLLNQLEWFAMNCQYGIADEALLYQSLHQTYLSMIWMLYPTISNSNVNNEDKTFTNVIWLFNLWRDRLSKIKEETEKKKQEYQKKADNVQSPIFTGSKLK